MKDSAVSTGEALSTVRVRSKYHSFSDYVRNHENREDVESVSSTDSGYMANVSESHSSSSSSISSEVKQDIPTYSSYRNFLNTYGKQSFKSVAPPSVEKKVVKSEIFIPITGDSRHEECESETPRAARINNQLKPEISQKPVLHVQTALIPAPPPPPPAPPAPPKTIARTSAPADSITSAKNSVIDEIKNKGNSFTLNRAPYVPQNSYSFTRNFSNNGDDNVGGVYSTLPKSWRSQGQRNQIAQQKQNLQQQNQTNHIQHLKSVIQPLQSSNRNGTCQIQDLVGQNQHQQSQNAPQKNHAPFRNLRNLNHTQQNYTPINDAPITNLTEHQNNDAQQIVLTRDEEKPTKINNENLLNQVITQAAQHQNLNGKPQTRSSSIVIELNQNQNAEQLNQYQNELNSNDNHKINLNQRRQFEGFPNQKLLLSDQRQGFVRKVPQDHVSQPANKLSNVEADTVTRVPVIDPEQAQIDKNDPMINKMVYDTYRDFLRAYNKTARTIVATMPNNAPVQDKTIAERLNDIESRGGLGHLSGRTMPKEDPQS